MFIWNIDGVLIFKLFNFFLWFLYLVINELFFKKVFFKDSIILVGLWFGCLKFVMWIYFKLFYLFLSELEKEGIIVESFDKLGIMNVCVVFLCGICDFFVKVCVCNIV